MIRFEERQAAAAPSGAPSSGNSDPSLSVDVGGLLNQIGGVVDQLTGILPLQSWFLSPLLCLHQANGHVSPTERQAAAAPSGSPSGGSDPSLSVDVGGLLNQIGGVIDQLTGLLPLQSTCSLPAAVPHLR